MICYCQSVRWNDAICHPCCVHLKNRRVLRLGCWPLGSSTWTCRSLGSLQLGLDPRPGETLQLCHGALTLTVLLLRSRYSLVFLYPTMRRNIKILLIFSTAWMFAIVYYLQTTRDQKVITFFFFFNSMFFKSNNSKSPIHIYIYIIINKTKNLKLLKNIPVCP